jgi:hypothetical protein
MFRFELHWFDDGGIGWRSWHLANLENTNNGSRVEDNVDELQAMAAWICFSTKVHKLEKKIKL